MILWQVILIPGMATTVQNSLFADGTLIFGKSNVKETTRIKYALYLYSEVSGRSINTKKSKTFIFNNNEKVAQKISATLAFPVYQT